MLEPVCSDSSLSAEEPLIGSAPDAVAWMCLEQNGPWGPKAWTASHLDPDLGGRIEAAANRAGVRPSLIRHPGRHADLDSSGTRTVMLAHTHPDSSWLLTGSVDDPAAVLDLDLDALAAGDRAAVAASLTGLSPDPRPHLLVCTNGTRDTCCARLGRPVALAAAALTTDQVWEVTHTSGHRFAPTTVLLPSGYLHGRVLDGSLLLEAASTGQLVLSGMRGRSTWSPPGQAAEELVRATAGITGLDDLGVTGSGSEWVVSHRDGRTWRVVVTTEVSGERAQSCGKVLKPIERFAASLR